MGIVTIIVMIELSNDHSPAGIHCVPPIAQRDSAAYFDNRIALIL
jgi:hypothetical protein